MIIAKKSLGQHWLEDEISLEAICELAGVEHGELIVEIGPGHGSLTNKLLLRGAKVIAVELDSRLVSELPSKISSNKQNLEVVEQDILGFNFNELPSKYKVVANIPYYLTSNLIRTLSEATNPPDSVTLLIQKEVAQRLCAGPGDMSLLSVWAQMYFICSLGPIVPAALFTPPPKVDSQIVHLERREQPIIENQAKKLTARVIKAGFSNKRKTVLNSLSAGLHKDKDDTRKLLVNAGIDPSTRPQELSIDQWVTLTQCVDKTNT